MSPQIIKSIQLCMLKILIRFQLQSQKKKIFGGMNLCNSENKTDVISCIRIGSLLLKINEPRDHVWVPQGFPKGRDTFLSSSTRPQVLLITKSHGMESSSPVRVQLRIQEQSTLKLMPRLHKTCN
jgi:hypothetical protein